MWAHGMRSRGSIPEQHFQRPGPGMDMEHQLARDGHPHHLPHHWRAPIVRTEQVQLPDGHVNAQPRPPGQGGRGGRVPRPVVDLRTAAVGAKLGYEPPGIVAVERDRTLVRKLATSPQSTPAAFSLAAADSGGNGAQAGRL